MDFGRSHGGSLLWLDNQLYFTIKQLEEEVVRNLLTLKKRFLLQFVFFQLQVFCFTVWIICCQMLKCSCKLVESLQQVNTFLSWDSFKEWLSNYCLHTYFTFTYCREYWLYSEPEETGFYSGPGSDSFCAWSIHLNSCRPFLGGWALWWLQQGSLSWHTSENQTLQNSSQCSLLKVSSCRGFPHEAARCSCICTLVTWALRNGLFQTVTALVDGLSASP